MALKKKPHLRRLFLTHPAINSKDIGLKTKVYIYSIIIYINILKYASILFVVSENMPKKSLFQTNYAKKQKYLPFNLSSPWSKTTSTAPWKPDISIGNVWRGMASQFFRLSVHIRTNFCDVYHDSIGGAFELLQCRLCNSSVSPDSPPAYDLHYPKYGL